MGIRTARSSVWQWRWRFVRTAPNCLLDAINKAHTQTDGDTDTARDRDTDVDTANGCQNWRRKTAQTEDWQRHLVSVLSTFSSSFVGIWH